jgi:hypothetical protein
MRIRLNRKLLKLLAIGGAVELGRRLGPRRRKMWQRVFAKMPDDFPPKAMFLNIKVIRKQNERIIQLLEKRQTERDPADAGRPLRTAI